LHNDVAYTFTTHHTPHTAHCTPHTTQSPHNIADTITHHHHRTPPPPPYLCRNTTTLCAPQSPPEHDTVSPDIADTTGEARVCEAHSDELDLPDVFDFDVHDSESSATVVVVASAAASKRQQASPYERARPLDDDTLDFAPVGSEEAHHHFAAATTTNIASAGAKDDHNRGRGDEEVDGTLEVTLDFDGIGQDTPDDILCEALDASLRADSYNSAPTTPRLLSPYEGDFAREYSPDACFLLV
jgi:hypothetical protein